MGRASVMLAVCAAFLAAAIAATALGESGGGQWLAAYESGQMTLRKIAPLAIACLLWLVAALCVLPEESGEGQED